MSRNPKAEIGPAHGLAVIVWATLDVDTWPEFGARIADALQRATGKATPRSARALIRSFWPSDG